MCGGGNVVFVASVVVVEPVVVLVEGRGRLMLFAVDVLFVEVIM